MEQFVHYIDGVQKKIEKSDIEQTDLILPHEHLFQTYPPNNNDQQQMTTQITLQSLSKLRENPTQSYQNLVLADPIEIDSELKLILQENSIKKVLVLDSTNKENQFDSKKIKEVQQSNHEQIDISFGFSYLVDKNELYKEQEKNLIMHSIENITNATKYEFSIGNSQEIKPCFLGEICLDQIDFQDQIQQQVLKSYFQVSNEYNTPIYFNLQNKNENYIKITKLFNDYSNMSYNHKVYVLWNPYINFEYENINLNQGQELVISKVCKQLNQLIDLLKKGYVLGFDTLRYSQQQFELAQILIQLCQTQYNFSNQILISSGVTYKTDLVKYGGNGFLDAFYFKQLLKNLKFDELNLQKLFKQNFTDLFMWAKYKVKQKEIKWWTCPMCKKEFNEEEIDKFKKFGKEFCSMKCLQKFLNK